MTEEIIQEVQPTYGDLYLKFPDEAQATATLEGYEGSIDVIGVIYERTGGTDDEPIMTALPGWHVNTRGPLSAELSAFAVVPKQPHRIWA
jgi:hypothetical protein